MKISEKNNLQRRYSNETVIKAIEVLKEHDIGSFNSKFDGIPFENRELFLIQ